MSASKQEGPWYGEYKCPICHRSWQSSKAWKEYGQKCKHCAIMVNAAGLEELFFYVCRPCFKQSKGKEGRWKWKKCLEGRPCNTCGEMVKPLLTRAEYVNAKFGVEVEDVKIDSNKGHERHLCEKCQVLGHYCGRTQPLKTYVKEEVRRNRQVTPPIVRSERNQPYCSIM